MSRYIDYCKALQKAKYFEDEICKALAKTSFKVYTIYVAVGDEEEDT